MSISRAIDISASGLQAGRLRMDVIAQNIANVESTEDGGTPYRRKEVVLATQAGGGTADFESARLGATTGGVRVVGVREDQSPAQYAYKPDDPAADARGYVRLPNVNLPMEMVDMMAATRAYEANAAALKVGRDLVRRALDIMR